jgi:hypothetical protein
MAILTFKDLAFDEADDKIEITFLRLFHCFVHKSQLEKIGKFRIKEHSIEFSKSVDAEQKFSNLLNVAFEDLKNKINGKRAVYVHKHSGIPLIGHIAFGLIDRNTNIIELRPISTCNLNCIYCSVDAEKRQIEFIVEKDYLVDEFRKIVDFKRINNIEAHINAQGEPLLYADIVDLVRDLRAIKHVGVISMDTNGTMLTEKLADELVDAGLTRFNISLNALNPEVCGKIAGVKEYNLNGMLDICRHISKKADLILAPVWLKGINDDEISKIIEFAKTLQNKKHKIILGIQNFLYYKFGKNPVKEQSWDKFRKFLSELEEKYKVRLILDFKKDFDIVETNPLPKMFKKGQVLNAKVILPGQLNNEFIAVAYDRIISVFGKAKIGRTHKVRITRTKHNIFSASIIQ